MIKLELQAEPITQNGFDLWRVVLVEVDEEDCRSVHTIIETTDLTEALVSAVSHYCQYIDDVNELLVQQQREALISQPPELWFWEHVI